MSDFFNRDNEENYEYSGKESAGRNAKRRLKQGA